MQSKYDVFSCFIAVLVDVSFGNNFDRSFELTEGCNRVPKKYNEVNLCPYALLPIHSCLHLGGIGRLLKRI